jgi:hypothetical protein
MKDPYLALFLLVQACRHKTGQSYKLRGLLYSLWNGKPYSLLEIITLDRVLREHLLTVLEHFGSDLFFYKEIKDAFTQAGLFDWFCDQANNEP